MSTQEKHPSVGARVDVGIHNLSTNSPVSDGTSVLIIGGSLVGLSAAVFLASRGVQTILVERHKQSSQHPRAIGFTTRTLELFRTVGLDSQIPPNKTMPPNYKVRRRQVESLAGRWLEESDWTPEKTPEKPATPKPEFSQCMGVGIAQDLLEPILRDKARALGADLRLGVEFLRFEQDATGVIAWLRERDGGREYTVRADYMIAADGGRSSIRDTLAISRSGRGHIQTVRSVLFRAPLEEYLKSGVVQFEIEQPGLKAFLTTYGDGRWVLMFTDDVERDEATQLAAIKQAIGRSDLPIDIITTGRWELGAVVADRFASGRVFLAGDAAHCFPPTRGGFGANTGIHDVHNLAWKLSAVLSGVATKELLDTYDAERHPVAWTRFEQIFARPDFKDHADGFDDGVTILDDDAMEFGELYRSASVLGAGPELPAAARPDEWAGQPGTRAPHVWIQKGGKRISTLDLFGREWVLLADDGRWSDSAAKTSEKLGIVIEPIVIGKDIEPSAREALRQAFGVKAGGASLIRPDQYVAWRSVDFPAEPAAALTAAMAKVSFSKRGTKTAQTVSLEARIQRLEDIEAIKDLMWRYSFHVNKGWNGKEVDVDAMDLIYAQDARCESKLIGMSATGIDDIKKSLREATKIVEFSMHSFTNPIIEVDGDTAKGNWLMWVASRLADGPPNEVFMSYDLTYVRTTDGWRIKTVYFHFGMTLNDLKDLNSKFFPSK